ncbi:MAG: YncE family protein [Rhodospirillales bacterium]|nr:YncE family protein [Rhodospirillales bacterium]
MIEKAQYQLSRRAALTAAIGVAAISTPERPTFAAADQGLALVLNSASASFSVIDVASRKLIRTTPVLREPHHWALLPDQSALLVGDTSANTLFHLNPNTGEIVQRTPMSDPYQLWFGPGGRHLVVTALAVEHVDIYDGKTLQLLKRLRLPTMPSHISFAPDGNTVFVSLQSNGRLVGIDLRTLTTSWQVSVGKAPAGVFWHDHQVLVGIMGGDYVAVTDPANGREIRRVKTGRGAHNLFYAPDGQSIYVTNRVEGSVSLLNAATLDVVRTYNVPNGPDCIAFAPDGRLWVSMRWGGRVAVLDPKTGTHETIAVGRSPHGVFLTRSPTLPGAGRPAALSLSTA